MVIRKLPLYLSTLILLFPTSVISESYLHKKRNSSEIKLLTIASKSDSATSYDTIQADPCDALLESGEADVCEPNVAIHLDKLPSESLYESNLWCTSPSSLENLGLQNAWDVTTGSSDVVIATIDTGIDYTHPDLIDNIWVNPNEISSNGIDDDGNGYIDDINGVNLLSTSAPPFDDNGHGTHVAGIIGARGDNGLGIVGISWNVKILAVKTLDALGAGNLYDSIKAIDYITDLKLNHQINIVAINASWGMSYKSLLLEEAIKRANDAGILFVAAAGNNASNADVYPQYPAAFSLDGIISVAATDSTGALASFSNYGQFSVDIAAPGVSILSTYPNNQYTQLSGTSMATPFVTGAIALLSSVLQNSNTTTIKDRLLTSGQELVSLNGVTYSGRLLNVERLIYNNTTPLQPPQSTPPSYPSNMTIIYYDLFWTVGQQIYIYIYGSQGDTSTLTVNFKHGTCRLPTLRLENSVSGLSLRTSRSRLNGTASLVLSNASGATIETHKIKLLANYSKAKNNRRAKQKAISTKSASVREIGRWCRGVKLR